MHERFSVVANEKSDIWSDLHPPSDQLSDFWARGAARLNMRLNRGKFRHIFRQMKQMSEFTSEMKQIQTHFQTNEANV